MTGTHMTDMQDTLQPNPSMDDDEISLLDLAQTVVDNLRLLVLGPLAVGVAALGISFAITPTFTAQVAFLPPQQSQSMAAGLLNSLGALGGLAGAAAGIKNPNDQYVAFLTSRSLEDALIDRFDLMKRYDEEYRKDLYETMEKKYISVASGKDGLITVEVNDEDPQFAADLANAHVDELSKLMGRLAVTEAQQRRQFFDQQLAKAKDGLIAAEQALKKIGISADVLKASPVSAVASVATLQAQLTAQQVKIGNMRGYLAESAPEFKQALNELASIRAQLSKAEQSDATPGKSDDYISRYREFKYQETLFELYAKQLELAKADEAREGATIQVVDPAVAPDLKSKPKRGLIALLATLVSGFVLLLFVFMRQAFRNGTQDAETAQKIQSIRSGFCKALGR